MIIIINRESVIPQIILEKSVPLRSLRSTYDTHHDVWAIIISIADTTEMIYTILSVSRLAVLILSAAITAAMNARIIGIMSSMTMTVLK